MMDKIKQRKNWERYQKYIPDDNFYYLRSCIRQNFFPASEYYFLKILRENLGKNIYDDSDHTTCTGIAMHSDIVPFETTQTVVARHFALMTEKGYKHAAVSCVTSFGIYNEILEYWKEFPGELEKTRYFLKKATGREFELPETMSHTSDIIYKFREELAQQSKFKLINAKTGEPLNVVEHIGCHYAKIFPDKGIGGAEFPQVLVGIVEAFGGNVVDYPERRHCCGFGFRQYLVRETRGYSLANSYKKFESMKDYQVDLIVANCPGCTMFLDKWQYVIDQMEGKKFGRDGQQIPVLTYEELVGLMLGYSPWDLGLQMHQVSVENLLDKLGIPYNPEEKFLNKQGLQIGSK